MMSRANRSAVKAVSRTMRRGLGRVHLEAAERQPHGVNRVWGGGALLVARVQVLPVRAGEGEQWPVIGN